MREPALSDIARDLELSQGLFEDDQATIELSAHDPVSSVSFLHGAAPIGLTPAEVRRREARLAELEGVEVDVLEQETDHRIAHDPIDEARHDRREPFASADASQVG